MADNDTAPSESVEEVTAEETAETAPQSSAGEPDDADKPKGTRAKIGALETERDGLRAQLDAAHAQTFDRAVESLNMQPALMRAAGLSVADYMNEDGTVDLEALTVAADAKRAELGLSRSPRPNSVAGRNRNNSLGAETRSLGQILRETVRPAG